MQAPTFNESANHAHVTDSTTPNTDSEGLRRCSHVNKLSGNSNLFSHKDYTY